MLISTNRPSITVAGITLLATAPYAAGHVLTENEASVLNQTSAENLRNNFAKTVAVRVEASSKNGHALDLAALQAEFDAYITGYAFGERRTGTTREVDPVKRMALAIASEAVRAALKTRGFKLGEKEGQISKDQFQKLVEAQAAKEAILKEAKRRVDAQAKVATDDLFA